MVAGKLNASFGRLKDGLKGLALRPLRGTLLGRWLCAERGAASAEFALIGLLLTTMTIGVMELAAVLIVNVLVEGGLREASRAGITGYVPAGQSRQDMIFGLIGQHTLGMVTPATATIDIRVYPSFNSVGQPEPFADVNGSGTWDDGEAFNDVNGNGVWDPDMGTAGLGGPGDVVQYRVIYDWRLLTGLLVPALSSDGNIRLSATVVVRNEPY
jgi:Flp pilus assembly protein TadG